MNQVPSEEKTIKNVRKPGSGDGSKKYRWYVLPPVGLAALQEAAGSSSVSDLNSSARKGQIATMKKKHERLYKKGYRPGDDCPSCGTGLLDTSASNFKRLAAERIAYTCRDC